MSQQPEEAKVEGAEQAPPAEAAVETPAPETNWEALANERTSDLQRLQAEYVNYKRRVDRDRALARQDGVEKVVRDLMPVLDSVALAKTHEDLTGGATLIADELEKLAGKYGLVQFGEVGEPFDPMRHEALMQAPLESGPVETPTISQVIQPGWMLGERVVRPARVAVANP